MTNAIQYDILTTIQGAIQARGLLLKDGTTALSSSNVILQPVPSNEDSDLPAESTRYPCIVVAPLLPEDLPPPGGTNVRDDVTYKVVVAIMASKLVDFVPLSNMAASLNCYLTWRESIRKLFHKAKLGTGGALSHQVIVQPLSVVDREAWTQRQMFASALLLNCTNRETRG